MKKLFTTMLMAAFALTSFAGGLLTNTNQHAAFVRNPARFASLGVDAVYFNPAGTAFLEDGWHLSANWQMIWQQRDAIDQTMGQNKKYEGKVYVPCMPTILAAYKTGDWTFSGFFGMPGGGGKAEFENGLPSFGYMAQSMIIPQLMQGFNAQTQGLGQINGTSVGSQFESTQYMFALQLGAAYKFTENFSAYAGVRANYISNNYQGSIYGALDASVPNPSTGQMVPYPVKHSINVDMDQSGVAFAPIVGVDYKVGDFNFGAKYEFRAVTTVENDTKTPEIASALPCFADGYTLRSDAPAMLALAGSWQVVDRLQIMAGWNYYFDKDAKVQSLLDGADNMRKLSRNTLEYLFGAEFNVTEKFLISAGIQFSNFGINDEYISDLGFTNDSFMTGVGGKYSLTEKVDINFGYCYANYAPDKCVKSTGLTTRYERKTHNATVGVDFRF